MKLIEKGKRRRNGINQEIKEGRMALIVEGKESLPELIKNEKKLFGSTQKITPNGIDGNR